MSKERSKSVRRHRAAGVALIVGSSSLFLSDRLHPPDLEENPAAYAQLIQDNLGVWIVSHTLWPVAIWVWLFGFVLLYRILNERGEDLYSLASLIGWGIVAVSAVLLAIVDGFMNPIFARALMTADPESQPVVITLWKHKDDVVLGISTIFLFGLYTGLGFLAVSLRKAQLYAREFTVLGILLAMLGLPIFALSMVYEVPPIAPHLMLAVPFLPVHLILIQIWVLFLGFFTYREGAN